MRYVLPVLWMTSRSAVMGPVAYFNSGAEFDVYECLVCIVPQNASVALGPLVITPERYEVIDFTQSFDVARLSAVLRHDAAPRRSPYAGGPLQFVRPLSGAVWTLLGVVLVATTILLYTCLLYTSDAADE